MRTLSVTLTAVLMFFLAGCATPNGGTGGGTEVPVVDGTSVISYAMAGDGARVRIGGKTFQVAQRLITWDRGGSLKLAANWGLLELRETPSAVEVNLDGVVVTTVGK